MNYRGVRTGELNSLLKKIAWAGDAHRAAAYFDRLLEIADKITVAVTFANGQALPGLGMEILFEEPPMFDPRWRQLFELLCELNCCRPQEAEALLHLEGRFYPYDRQHDWPASWILAIEENGGLAVPRVDRSLSHVKVSVSPGGKLSAKAYVSARLRWEEASGNATDEREACPRLHGESVDAAVTFLSRQRLQNGWWTEFHTRLGPSDEWTTAFVGGILAQCANPEARRLAGDAAARLMSRQREDGGWGYNAGAPSDADTTAWVVKLLRQVDLDSAVIKRGLAFLRHHGTAHGTVATYRPDVAIAFAGEEPLLRGEGWQSGHLCVSANAAVLLGEEWIDALAVQQHPEGFWQPYWWRTPALATALACETLMRYPKYGERVARAVSWAKDFQTFTHSAFVESWLVRVLLCGASEDRLLAARRIAVLRSQQRPDGSWPSSADLSIPAAEDSIGTTAPDKQYERKCVFTTASVLASLLLCGGTQEAGC